MLKTATRKLNQLERMFLTSKENIQFAVEVIKPDFIHKVIQNIKNYDLGLHLKLYGSNFVWNNDPIKVYSLPNHIKSCHEACEYVDSIKFDYEDTFSVIAANDRIAAISVSHAVCDGGFFKDLYDHLLDDEKQFSNKPHMPLVATDFFQSELSKVTNEDLRNHGKEMGKLIGLDWSKNHDEINNEANKKMKCKYYFDESDADDFQFFKSNVSLIDMYHLSLALSIMSLNRRFHPKIGINTCVDMRRYIEKSKRSLSNTQNASIVPIIKEDINPKTTIRDLSRSLHQILMEKLSDNSSFITLQSFFTDSYFAEQNKSLSPLLSNVGRFNSDDRYSKIFNDVWIQQKVVSDWASVEIFMLTFSKMKNGKNTLVTRIQQPLNVINDDDANILLKSIMHVLKEVNVDVSFQDAYDELRSFQRKINKY